MTFDQQTIHYIYTQPLGQSVNKDCFNKYDGPREWMLK